MDVRLGGERAVVVVDFVEERVGVLWGWRVSGFGKRDWGREWAWCVRVEMWLDEDLFGWSCADIKTCLGNVCGQFFTRVENPKGERMVAAGVCSANGSRVRRRVTYKTNKSPS